jgi:hypothetical protein
VQIDAPVHHDAPADSPPDAYVPTVSGLLFVADVSVADAAAASVGGLSGGTIDLEFADIGMGGGSAVYGTNPVGGCVITEYDPTHTPSPLLDAGPVTIADDTTHPGGLTRTIGPCAFDGTSHQYMCISNHQANVAVTSAGANSTAPGTVAQVFTGTPFTGQNLQGSWININGFTTAAYNSGAAAFPIVANPSTSQLLVANPAGTNSTPEPAASGITYTVLNGVGPVPGGADFFAGGGGTTGNPGPSIHISKAANTVWPAIDVAVDVIGENFSLSDPGNPTAFPLGTAAVTDQVYGCATGGTCGDTSSATLKGIVLAGHATRKSLAGLAPFQMPTEVPGTDTWLTWNCVFLSSQSGTMPAAAVQVVHDFAPTRVEQRVIEATFNILNSGNDSTNLVVGHAIVGHTTAP